MVVESGHRDVEKRPAIQRAAIAKTILGYCAHAIMTDSGLGTEPAPLQHKPPIATHGDGVVTDRPNSGPDASCDAATNGAQRAKVGNLSDMDPDDTVVYHQRNAKLGDLSDIAELTERPTEATETMDACSPLGRDDTRDDLSPQPERAFACDDDISLAEECHVLL